MTLVYGVKVKYFTRVYIYYEKNIHILEIDDLKKKKKPLIRYLVTRFS